MRDGFRSTPEQSQSERDREVMESFDALLEQGDVKTSPHSFVQEVRTVTPTAGERKKLRRIAIDLDKDRNGGFGYVSSSSKHDRTKELLVTSHLADCFLKREVSTKPIIISVDDFYTFLSEQPSLVEKTRAFDRLTKITKPGQDFAIILSDFTGSKIFTEQILEQVPTQLNAGLELDNEYPLKKRPLFDFATTRLPKLIEQEKGNLDTVLKIISGDQGEVEENARLLLATGLLLQDRQLWQQLRYETTALYIVAPMNFHDAMNRLNKSWGFGDEDYSHRAHNALGNHDKPLLEESVELKDYKEQGLSAEEFEKRVGPLLEQFKK